MPNVTQQSTGSVTGQRLRIVEQPDADEFGVLHVTVGFCYPPLITPDYIRQPFPTSSQSKPSMVQSLAFVQCKTQEQGLSRTLCCLSHTKPGVNGFQPSTLYKIAKAVMKQPLSEHEGLPLRQLLVRPV